MRVRRTLALIAITVTIGFAAAGCAYTPVPGAETTLTASPEASAGGR